MSLLFNIERKVVEFNGYYFPMCEKIVSKFRKKFGNDKKSVELSLDTLAEVEKALRGIFSYSHEFEGTIGTLYLMPPKKEYDSSHGGGDWEKYHWNVEIERDDFSLDFYLQEAGDGKPALNWVQDPPQEDLREEYIIFDEIDWDI